MKKAVSILLSLLMAVNMCAIYVFAEGTETEEDILDLFSEYINRDSGLTEAEDVNVNGEEEKAPPCSVTIDDDFEEGEVLLYLTRAQSAARQEYTAADFPGLDIEEITVGPYFPESNNQIFISLILTQKDKSSVIEAVRILEQNPMVYCASPNLIFEVIDAYDSDEDILNEISAASSTIYNNNELNSHLRTYACCAKKYTDPNKNNTVKVGVIGGGIYNDKDISSKVVQYVDFSEDNVVKYYYTEPTDEHETLVSYSLARGEVPGKSYIHSDCGNNVFTGVCENVELYSLKVSKLDLSNNKVSNMRKYTDAINYAKEQGVRVLVCTSLFPNGYKRNDTFESAAANFDGIIVTSSGRYEAGADKNTHDCSDIDVAQNIVYPTSCLSDNVIVVGECNYGYNTTVCASASCYGKNNVDLFAPGYIYDDIVEHDEVYGNSFSAPRVAGAAAVLLNICPTLTKSQLRHYILAGVDVNSGLADKCVTGGSLNVYKSAKLLIADCTSEWKTVFAGHFTRTDKMQVAAYCQVDGTVLKCYIWTYDTNSGTFSDPEHWFTNSQYALLNEVNISYNMYRSVAGDFDGNGYTEICTLYDWADNIFVVGNGYDAQTGTTNGLPVENFTGRVVALDYDNDGRDEVAALYYDPQGAWGHTKLYTWDFEGVGSGMHAIQRMCYDSGAGNYAASYTTDKVVAGDFDGDGAEELAAVYRYPETGKYSLHKFDIWTGGAGYTNLIYKKDDIDASKIAGRVVSCNYDGDNIDDVVCMYDNSQVLSNGIINYGFRFTSGVNTWGVTQLYSSSEGVYDADRSTYLMLAGDFRGTGRDDIVTFYKIPIGDILKERTRIYMCLSPSMIGYNKVWDPID